MLKEATGFAFRVGKAKVLLATAGLVLLVAVVDWSVGPTLSLGVLYILPMMLGALVLRPGETAALAVLCAFLRFCFDVPSSHLEASLRFVFASISYFASALFVIALVRNREMMVANLARVEREQALRREAEEQVRVLVESSPAAILTLDDRGVVLAANRAAEDLFAIPQGQTVQGRVIASYLPLLSDALGIGEVAGQFRTSAQCYGRREDGEIFLAHTWFSTYQGADGKHLAAIVVDSSEEMRDREEQNLRLLVRHNRIAAAAMSHDVRNLCGAVSLLCTNLSGNPQLSDDPDFQGLVTLVKGLEQVAGFDLQSRSQETIEEIDLRAVLDNLRIVIEPGWKEVSGSVRWCLPPEIPDVLADPHGLLQAFLNLAQNSLRAAQDSPVRELTIAVSTAPTDQRVFISFEDTGPGVASPEILFQPFQPGADGTGLGLYISRAVVRSYGGELRFEPRERGTRFVVELQAVS
jgi:two-component system, LuxR family, sensor kinase FixL